MSDPTFSMEPLAEVELDSPHPSTSTKAVPKRMIFCTHWRIDDGHLEIGDEFDRITLQQLPHEMGTPPAFLIVLWEGVPHIKPLLAIDGPSEMRLLIRLPQLTRSLVNQIQVYSLIGFCFNEAGNYVFRVSVDGECLEHRLTVVHEPFMSLVDGAET